jgi:hypothetical protein
LAGACHDHPHNVGVSDDRLPARAAPPISEEVRQRGIDFLQGLVASGQVDLDRFQTALDGLLEAQSHADFASVIRALPPPVKFIVPERRRQEPLEITTSMGEIRLDGRWQVGRLTKIHTNMGMVIIDLTEAEFDDWEVEIDVHTNMGSITVIAPQGLDVRLVGKSSAVKSTLQEPIPGFPVVRISASTDMGTVDMRHARETTPRRWGRRRRRNV